MENGNLSEIKIRCITSYDGLTISFDSEEVYDEYRLYRKVNNDYQMIVSTEDILVSNKYIIEGDTYFVKGYKKENNSLLLKAISEEYICKPLQKQSIMDRPRISVICPVYNAESIVSNCMDSVLLSTLEGIEMILVDDGSQDRSKEVIHWYEEYYPGIIKYVYQENQGVSFARNRGIEEASGKYIAFIDDDDYIHPRMYEKLYEAAEATKSPIAIGKTIIREPNGTKKICLDVPKEGNNKYFTMSYDEMMKIKFQNDIHNIYFVAVWHKIIKADLVKQHRFPQSNHYEDTAYTRMIYSHIDQFSFAYDAYYVWDQRRRNTVGTATTTNYKSTTDDVYEIHKKFFVAQFYGIEEGNREKIAWLLYDIIQEIYYYLKKSNCLDYNNELNRIAFDYIKNYFSKDMILENQHIQNNQEIYQYITNKEW